MKIAVCIKRVPVMEVKFAITADGTRVDANYVNLGTMLLRGTTPGGRVDIPWQNIQTIEFRR